MWLPPGPPTPLHPKELQTNGFQQRDIIKQKTFNHRVVVSFAARQVANIWSIFTT
jgi:hypothetical protein